MNPAPIPVLTVPLPTVEATEMLGAQLALLLDGGRVVTLSGDLGAGKTTLVRGWLRALGFSGPVKSPSYTLVEEYPFSRLYFYHFDFYRFKDPAEWDLSGFSEYFRRDALCVIEWPEKLGDRLPPVDLAISLDTPPGADSARVARLTAVSSEGAACLTAIKNLHP